MEAAAAYNLGPLPKKITGGCLCGSLRYEAHFPENHDFKDNSGTCQCTQCRRSTSHLFFIWQKVPFSHFQWTSPSTASLKNFYCTPGNARGFCSGCGTFLYWRREAGPNINIPIGTIDPLYLFGEGWEESGGEVPRGGFGRALANVCGGHEWTRNEIPGVTDELELCGAGPRGRGERDEGE